MNRATLAGFALMATGAVAWFAFAQDDRGLCVNGHPAPRKPGITYGGLAPMYGYERDHIVPLGLGGPDVASNVQYQPREAARISDVTERYAERQYCAGKLTLQQARKMVADQKGR